MPTKHDFSDRFKEEYALSEQKDILSDYDKTDIDYHNISESVDCTFDPYLIKNWTTVENLDPKVIEQGERFLATKQGEDKIVTQSSFQKDIKPTVAPRIDYYDAGGIGVIEYIKAKLTKEQYIGFLLGNILKYSSRLQHKGDAKNDSKKLAVYSKWLEESVSDDIGR